MDFSKLILKLLDFAKDYILNSNKKEIPRPQARPVQQPAAAMEDVEIERTDAEWNSIRENVPVTDLAGFANDEFKLYKTRPTQAYKAEWGQPYTFVLESGGSAKGVVMLGNGHSHDSNVKYLIARMYAKKLGIPYINFYTQMPNEKNYVIGRIRKLMG